MLDNGALTELGDALRSSETRTNPSEKIRENVAAISSNIVSAELDEETLLLSIRVLVNFVADSIPNRQILAEHNGDELLKSVISMLGDDSQSTKVRLYSCIFIRNWVNREEGKEGLWGAEYLNKLSPWTTITRLFNSEPDDLQSQAIDVLEELCQVEKPAADLADLKILLGAYLKSEEPTRIATVLEAVCRNDAIDLHNNQDVVLEILGVLNSLGTNHPDQTLLYHSAMSLSFNSSNKNDALKDYARLLEDSGTVPLVRALVFVILGNFISSSETKETLIKAPGTLSAFHAYFENDYTIFTNNQELKHLELQSVIFANKLITDLPILKEFKSAYLDSFLNDLDSTAQQLRFQGVYEKILLLNMKFIRRLIFSYQKNQQTFPKDQYEKIVSFGSRDYKIEDDGSFRKEIDMIRFALLDALIIGHQFEEDIDSLVSETFNQNAVQSQVSSDYFFEKTKTVALVLSRDDSITCQSWFMQFMEDLEAVVKQNPNWTPLINNYQYLRGKLIQQQQQNNV